MNNKTYKFGRGRDNDKDYGLNWYYENNREHKQSDNNKNGKNSNQSTSLITNEDDEDIITDTLDNTMESQSNSGRGSRNSHGSNASEVRASFSSVGNKRAELRQQQMQMNGGAAKVNGFMIDDFF